MSSSLGPGSLVGNRRPLPLSITCSTRFARRFFSPYSPLRSLVPRYMSRHDYLLQGPSPSSVAPTCKRSLTRKQTLLHVRDLLQVESAAAHARPHLFYFKHVIELDLTRPLILLQLAKGFQHERKNHAATRASPRGMSPRGSPFSRARVFRRNGQN